MSAGAFVLSRYEADNGQVLPVRVQPETVALNVGGGANAAPTGTLTAGATFARVSGGNRRYGVKCRSVTIRFTGALPAGYETGRPLRLPVLTLARYNGITVGGSGAYLGQPIVVLGKSAERSR